MGSRLAAAGLAPAILQKYCTDYTGRLTDIQEAFPQLASRAPISGSFIIRFNTGVPHAAAPPRAEEDCIPQTVLAFEKKIHIGYSTFAFYGQGVSYTEHDFKKSIVMIDIPLYMFVNPVATDTVTYQRYKNGFSPLREKSGGESGTCENRNWFADADYQPYCRLLPRP